MLNRRQQFLSAALVVAGSILALSIMPARAQNTQIKGQDEEVPQIDLKATWPCVQRRIETVSVSQFWDGPSIDGVKGWYLDKDVSSLIEVLASRRVPVEEAEAQIKAFAEKQAADKRDERLVLLFAGLFDKISGQRRSVISGIEKYQKAQRERADQLEQQSTALGELEKKVGGGLVADNPELVAAQEKFNWAQRIFQERQTSIPLACELPVLIEERLYAIAQAIRAQMKS